MDLSGEYRIPASRERVWEFLNDPDILKQCIPGCEAIAKDGDDKFSATVVLRIGPMKVRFTGNVSLTDKVYPESYRISGEGSGGIAGHAKGGANVRLTQDGSETILNYSVDTHIGGKIAQLGSRLISSTSKKLADQFFGKFTEVASQSVSA